MKCKKIVSTLLASAIITTSVFTGDFMTANAATVGESMPTPVATYTFDGTLSSKEGATAKAYAAWQLWTGISREEHWNRIYSILLGKTRWNNC